MIRRIVSFICTVALTAALTSKAGAEATKSNFLEGYLKARPLIAQAAAAEGGVEAIRSLDQLRYRYSGSIYNIFQTFDPQKDPPGGPINLTMAFDFKNNLFYQLVDGSIPGINAVASPVFYKDGGIYSLNNYQRQYSVTKGDPGPAFDTPSRYMPAVVLKRLLKNIKSAVWLGDGDVRGHAADVIEFSWDETTRYRLDFDKTDHTLLALRALAPDPLVGDAEVVIEYTGQQLVAGLRFPKRATSYRRGERYLDISLSDVVVNQPSDLTNYQIPPGFVEAPTKPVVTQKLDTNLYEVSEIGGGTYRSQFIDAGSYVIVFEALLNFPSSQQVISEIKKTLGDKPIRYVVLSHYHNDHAAGVGAYVAAGATIVTTKGNEAIVTGYARAGSILNGGSPRPALRPSFLDVTGDHLELGSDGDHKVVVYRIPDVLHVKEMLVLYDPATKTVIDGDLFAIFFPFSPAYQRFADWLQSSNAPAVEKIAGVHHPMMTLKFFLSLAAPQQNAAN